jgi:dihydrofolate synthase/folylpolyglutamate synthase
VIADRAVPQSVLQHAAAVGAVPRLIGRDFDLLREDGGWRRSSDVAGAPLLPLPPFGGEEQFVNAAACAQVVECLSAQLPVADAALTAGIARAYLRGRLEQHEIDGVQWLFDVGHNPAASARLYASMQRLPVARQTFVVFAAMRDNDLAGVVEPFVPLAQRWFVSQASADRGATTDELRSILHGLGATVVSAAASVAAACVDARAAAQPGDRVLVFGSFHTVGSATEALRLYCGPSPLVDRPTTWTRV